MDNATDKEQHKLELKVPDDNSNKNIEVQTDNSNKNIEVQTDTSKEIKSLFNIELTFQNIKYPIGIGILGIVSAGLWYLKKK